MPSSTTAPIRATATRPRPLYLSETMAELNLKCDKMPKVESSRLLPSCQTVLQNADKAYKDGDEEVAYLYFMRFYNLYKVLRETQDYKKDRRYHEDLIGRGTLHRVLKSVETLSENLEKRYEQQKRKKQEAKAEAETKKVQPLTKEEDEKKKKNPEKRRTFLTPKELCALFKDQGESFFLLDTRKASDYARTRIKCPKALNVPEEALVSGVTANALYLKISVTSRDQWDRRWNEDRLIILDWNSTKVVPGTPLGILYDALTKWDPSGSGKNPPIILKGGIEDFALMYPMEVVNPQECHNSMKKRIANNISSKKDNSIESIKYPDLDNGFIVTPSPSPRSSNDSPNPALASGAITIHKVSPQAVPSIPSRTTKPKTLTSINSESSSINSTDTTDEMNNAKLFDSTESSSVAETTTKPPPIPDRALKIKLNESEKNLLDSSIKTNEYMLKLERDLMRVMKMNEANEDINFELVKNQDKIVQELEVMRRKNKEYEAELEKVKREREAFMRKRIQEDVDKDLEKEVREKIKEQEAEKRRLQEDVEKKRQQRLERKREEKERKERLIEEKRKNIAEAEAKRREVEAKVEAREREQKLRQQYDQAVAISKAKLKDTSSSSPSHNPGSNLNRSYSSPNIANLIADEESRKFPPFEISRANKPKIIGDGTRRNFDPKWASGSTGKTGLTGLKNLGNTCYMNSILQCISNFKVMAMYFINQNTFERDLNVERSETKGAVAREYAALMSQLWSGMAKSISPYDMKRVVGRFNPSFAGHEQQDAHEFLVTLMLWLHNDLNEIRQKVTFPEQKSMDNLPDHEAAQRAWDLEQTADKSFIRQTFYGQRKSTLSCQTCGFKSIKYESFFELSLELPPGNGRCSLHDCINLYLRPVLVSWKCPKCNCDQDALKKFDIVKLPLILTVHLARFYNDGLWRKKQNFVEFELTDMNLGQYVLACRERPLNRYKYYSLYGVCNHFGSMEGGHYTAYCYSQVYSKWHKYDDHEVHELDYSQVKTPAAYILFYSAVSSD